jgi:hypothetical protein
MMSSFSCCVVASLPSDAVLALLYVSTFAMRGCVYSTSGQSVLLLQYALRHSLAVLSCCVVVSTTRVHAQGIGVVAL